MKKQNLCELIERWFKYMLNEDIHIITQHEIEELPEKIRNDYDEWGSDSILIFCSDGWVYGYSPDYVIVKNDESDWEFGILTKMDQGSYMQPEDWDIVFPTNEAKQNNPLSCAKGLIMRLLTQQVNNIQENYLLCLYENEEK